jgi:SNARE protein
MHLFLTGTEILQIVNPHNKDIKDIPGLAPPAQTRRLLYVRTGEHFD